MVAIFQLRAILFTLWELILQKGNKWTMDYSYQAHPFKSKWVWIGLTTIRAHLII